MGEVYIPIIVGSTAMGSHSAKFDARGQEASPNAMDVHVCTFDKS